MKCVIDANILIDLNNGGILAKLFALALDVSTPDAVLDEAVEIAADAALLPLTLEPARLS